MRRTLIATWFCAISTCYLCPAIAQTPITNDSPAEASVRPASRPEPIHLLLEPTPAARAKIGGTAEITPSTTNGAATLSIELSGLRPGMYSIVAVKVDQPDPLQLGAFLVGSPGAGPEKVAGEDHQEVSNSYQSEELKSHTELQLPPGLKPRQIDRIMITDRGGTTLLIGNAGTTPPR